MHACMHTRSMHAHSTHAHSMHTQMYFSLYCESVRGNIQYYTTHVHKTSQNYFISCRRDTVTVEWTKTYVQKYCVVVLEEYHTFYKRVSVIRTWMTADFLLNSDNTEVLILVPKKSQVESVRSHPGLWWHHSLPKPNFLSQDDAENCIHALVTPD